MELHLGKMTGKEIAECAWEENKVVRIKKRHYVKPKYDFS